MPDPSPPLPAANQPLNLRLRLTIVGLFVIFATVANLRWERWQCLDAKGAVLAESSRWLWSFQESEPAIIPAGGVEIVYHKWHFVPPVPQIQRVPVAPIYRTPAAPP